MKRVRLIINCFYVKNKIKPLLDKIISKSTKRVKKALNENFEYHHLALSRSSKFLRKHDSERLPMFVLYVDLVGSTQMSSDLNPNELDVIIRTFSQEMSYVIEEFGGYVLKFVGDAVLAYFYDKNSSTKSVHVIKCAETMHQVIDEAINPILEKEGLSKLQIKITVDFGNCSIVRYGVDKHRSHIDLIGLTLNLAAKMQSVTKPHQTTIGESVFKKLNSNNKRLFKKRKTTKKNWSFNQLGKKPYSIYSTN